MLNYVQRKFSFNCISYRMDFMPLDRLSALLEGLGPMVALTTAQTAYLHAPAGPAADPVLCVYLLSSGAAQLRAQGLSTEIQGPALVAVHGAQAHSLEDISAQDTCRLICARTQLTGPASRLFLEEFAQPRVIPFGDDEPALRMALGLIEVELAAPRCGQPALLNRAGDILFIGLLRHLVAHPSAHGTGLFNGLADPRIAKALVAMHQHAGFDWSLERLAEVAGMSRTAFASTFHAVMKRTPGKYLSAIRLALAQRAVELGKGLKEAARIAGYGNVSALSRALSRANGSRATWAP